MKRSTKQIDLSIVIPAYREEARIGFTLDELAKYLKTEKTLKNIEVEVVVVSADSPDKTHTIVLDKKKKFKNLSLLKPGARVGKGRDVKYGMLRAKGAAIIFMDADLATPLYHLPTFYKSYLGGFDVVVGTRNLKKHHPNFFRRFLSQVGNFLFKIAGGIWLEDSQCGFKLFSYKAAQACFSKLTIMGWGFDMEVLAIVKANGLTMKSYRINDWKSVPNGTFAGSIAINTLSSLNELAVIFKNRLLGKYRV